MIGLRFSKDLLPFISNLSREFTKYALSDISGMSSAYAIRIYELISQYRSIGKREIAVADLYQMLELGDRYPLFADFKRWVLETSVQQINENSPLEVSYELRKTGRKYTHVIFSFSLKKIIDVVPEQPKAMTEKRASILAHQLAIDPDFGSRYAHAGENLQQFEQRIKKDLINGNQDDKYAKYIKKYST